MKKINLHKPGNLQSTQISTTMVQLAKKTETLQYNQTISNIN